MITPNDEAMRIAEKTTYLNKEIQYLKNTSITEYDIHAAGFSVLKFRHLISNEKIAEFEKMDKHQRVVAEGNLEKANPKITEIILDTLGKVRKSFVLLNKINSEDILSIKKDAFFIISKPCSNLLIKDCFQFSKKRTYTSYINLNNNEFYFDSLNNVLDAKGISKQFSGYQFLEDLKKILRSAERINQENLYFMLERYRKQYLERQLPVETYRELESGMFRYKNVLLRQIDESMLSDLDITQNYMLYFLPLIGLLL